jgi:hypothetical protein
MNFLIDTLKGASLHVHAVWLALAYIAVIIAMAVDFVAGLRKAKQAGIASTSRGYKMTTEKAAKYFLPMLCLTCVDIMTSVILPAPFFTMLMGGFNIFCEWKSVMESTHDKQEMREAANTLNVIVKNKDDIVGIITQAMELMAKKQELESKNNNTNQNTIEHEEESNEH